MTSGMVSSCILKAFWRWSPEPGNGWRGDVGCERAQRRFQHFWLNQLARERVHRMVAAELAWSQCRETWALQGEPSSGFSVGGVSAPPDRPETTGSDHQLLPLATWRPLATLRTGGVGWGWGVCWHRVKKEGGEGREPKGVLGSFVVKES